MKENNFVNATSPSGVCKRALAREAYACAALRTWDTLTLTCPEVANAVQPTGKNDVQSRAHCHEDPAGKRAVDKILRVVLEHVLAEVGRLLHTTKGEGGWMDELELAYMHFCTHNVSTLITSTKRAAPEVISTGQPLYKECVQGTHSNHYSAWPTLSVPTKQKQKR